MPLHRYIVAPLFAASMCFVASSQEAFAEQYVWARTNRGASNIDRPYSSMSNGYGGYYVPVNAYGNNFESRGRFTNPTGFIVPANAPAQNFYRPRRFFR